MSNLALILRASVVVSVVEAAIMLGFLIVPASVQLLLGQYPWLIIVLDIIILTLVSSPIIYLWVIRPVVLARDKAELLLSLKNSTQPYDFLFEQLPQGVIIEDYSAVKKIIDQLVAEGIEDLKSYLISQPELLRELVAKARVIDANKAVLELYGYNSVEHYANDQADVSSWWNDDWLEFYASEITKFTSENKFFNSEITDTQSDGSVFKTRIISAVVKNDDTWKTVLNIHEDHTAQHEREQMLRDNKGVLEQLVTERTKELETAFKALEQSENFQAQCTHIAQLGYAVWDNDLDRDVVVSEELASVHGLTVDEYLHRVSSLEKYLEFVVPDDREKYMNFENRPSVSDQVDSVEYRITRTDGEIRHLIQNSELVDDPSGQRNQDIIVIQDITTLKRAEYQLKKSLEALKESEILRVASEAQYSGIIETANDGIVSFDENDEIILFNSGAEKIFGFTSFEIIGKPITDLIPDLFHDQHKQHDKNLSEGTQNIRKINERAGILGMRKNGYPFAVSATISTLLIRDKITFTVILQDVTEREALARENLRIAKDLTQLLDTANAPIFGLDTEGHVSEWNLQAEKITGYNKTEVMGLDLAAVIVIAEDFKAPLSRVLEEALKGKETANYEFPLLRKSGEQVDIRLNTSTRRDASGQIVGMVGVGQDITELNQVRDEQERERKEATAQIIQSSKLATLGEMATSVAHELNQPLNVIRMAAGNSRRKISKGTADPQYLTDKLLRIEEQSARAAAIIDHMRMFGRKAEENPEPIDPREVVTNALSLMGAQLRLAGIEVVTELAQDCPCVLGHTIQMEQVVLNLLTNARDALAERDGEAKITVRVFEDDKGVHITSEDTGGGIPDDVLPRIFEPFYTTKEMGKGTGLGLSVSYGIIREMNGTIVAENSNHGARFTITLPIVR